MLAPMILSLGLLSQGAPQIDDDAEVCRIVLRLAAKARVYDAKLRNCPRELHGDLEYRARQVPWDLVVNRVISDLGGGDSTDWTVDLRVAVPPDAPTNRLPTHDVAAPADPFGVALSDRFTAPAADRRVQLISASLVEPEDGLGLVLAAATLVSGGTVSPYTFENGTITLYSRRRALEDQEKAPGSGLATRCTPWLVFSEAGKPVDLVTHLPGACDALPTPFIEPMLWRWTPPRWDGQPFRVGVPFRHTGIGEFALAPEERFAPFYAGDTLVTDVPYPLKVARGGRPALVAAPPIEVPMVFPELLESRLGLEDASRIRCEVHLWAAPKRPTPYALSVTGCPEFFGSVVGRAYEEVTLAPPVRATEHIETVLFVWDDAKESWQINRK